MKYSTAISRVTSKKVKGYKCLKFQVKLLYINEGLFYDLPTTCLRSVRDFSNHLNVDEKWLADVIVNSYDCYIVSGNIFSVSKTKAKKLADFFHSLLVAKQLYDAG